MTQKLLKTTADVPTGAYSSTSLIVVCTETLKHFDQNFGTTKHEVPDSIKFKAEILLVIRTSFHPAVLLTVALSAAITALITCAVESDSIWLDYLSSSKAAITSTLGAFLALSLAFRTNICCELSITLCNWMEGHPPFPCLIFSSLPSILTDRPAVVGGTPPVGTANICFDSLRAAKSMLDKEPREA
eukprot:scaffold7989_cov111-Skeletonema_dohrnii-CCMP3373.AAC.3